MKKNKVIKISALTIFIILIFSSVVQAVFIFKQNLLINSFGNNDRGYSSWMDFFNDSSKIDPAPPGSGVTDNYVIEDGYVKMKNTYAIWTDPSWSRMKPIQLTNNAGTPITNCVIQINISYDSDMQSDYDDLRFKHESLPSTWLDYWLETYDSTKAVVWVEIPYLQTGNSNMYLFYGNPSVSSQSNFGNVFSWEYQYGDDQKISNKADNEGAWDPDVAYGNNRFLVAWEEGTYIIIRQEIRGSIFDDNGNIVVNDFLIFSDNLPYPLQFRNENPSIAFGGGKFFVAWQHYGTGSGVTDPTTMDIKGRTVTTGGGLGPVIDICTASNCQADANVAFDSVNNRFCVVWEDARLGTSNYNVYGRLYDTSGNPVGSEKTICSAANSQCEPWVAFDPTHEHYMIVWEDGETPDNGPFDIYAGLFDKNLNSLNTPVKLADGNQNIDYNFPCAEFCTSTQRFLVTWNNGDISSGNWRGNVWGTILDTSGNVVVPAFQISSGNYIRTDIVTYFNTLFFVTYDGNNKIYGKFLSSNGTIVSNDIIVSIGGSADADWANAAKGAGKIFVTWEDERIPSSSFPDSYGNILFQYLSSGVSIIIGTEKEIVLTAHVTSIKIQPSDLTYWNNFIETSTGSSIVFDILHGDTGAILLHDISNGYNLSGLTINKIRLMATLTRANPSITPTIDMWGVNYYTNDPPYVPSNPNPANGATNIDIQADLSWTGGDPDGDIVTYDVYFGIVSPPPLVMSNQSITTYDPGSLNFVTTYYWRIVSWDVYGASTSSPIWSFTTRVNNPPYVPSNPNPANGATNVDIQADLSWTGGDPDGDIVTYDVYFGIVSPPPLVMSNQSNTTYYTGTLNHDTTYYWRIVSWDFYGASTSGPIWSFTTRINHPPNTPSNPNPANGAVNIDINDDISWTGGDPDPGDLVTYDIYFGTTSPPPVIVYGYQTTNYDPGTMNQNTTYYWKIVAWDNFGESATGPIWSFTTKSNSPPNTPSNPNPANHATNVNVNIILTWSCSDPDGDDLTYNVFFGETSPPPLVSNNQTITSYDPPGNLDFSTTYYWQIIAYDEYGAYNISPIWDFTTKSNSPPNIWGRSPSNESTGIDINADISWQGSDPDGDTITYDVYFGTTSLPPLVISNQSSTYFNPGQMSLNTTYYWKLVAWDDKGASKEEPIWWFKTKEETNTRPNTPAIYNENIIMNLFIFIKPNVEYEFDFVASDSDGNDIYYFIDWGDGSNTNWLGPFQTSEHILVNHTWSTNMKFGTIKAKVKDVHGAESGETNLYYLTIKNKNSEGKNIIKRFLHRFLLNKTIFQKLLLLIFGFIKTGTKALNTLDN